MWGESLSRQLILMLLCYENYCIHKERRKCTDVFKVTGHIKIAGLEVACIISHLDSLALYIDVCVGTWNRLLLAHHSQMPWSSCHTTWFAPTGYIASLCSPLSDALVLLA